MDPYFFTLLKIFALVLQCSISFTFLNIQPCSRLAPILNLDDIQISVIAWLRRTTSPMTFSHLGLNTAEVWLKQENRGPQL